MTVVDTAGSRQADLARNSRFGDEPIKKFGTAETILHWTILFALGMTYGNFAYSQDGVLLSCEFEGGYPDNQIYIDEADRYVIYNAQLGESHERQRVFEDKSGGLSTLDVGMNITFNNEILILANDNSASFVFIKATLAFAYAFTLPVEAPDARWFAFGNFHQGKCSVNPFSKERE